MSKCLGSVGKTTRSALDGALAGELFAVVMGMMRSVAKEMRRPPQRLAPAQQAALAKLKHGAASMSELAGSLGVSVPTMSKFIDVLEERGWSVATLRRTGGTPWWADGEWSAGYGGHASANGAARRWATGFIVRARARA